MLQKLLRGIAGNWKTTIIAACAGIAVIATQLGAALDSDPLTVFDFDVMWQTGVVVLIGLFAKDGDKTSKDLKIDDK